MARWLANVVTLATCLFLLWAALSDAHDFRSQFRTRKPKTFIIKPNSGACGRGIFLIKRFEELDPNEHLVAQRYASPPPPP